MKKNIFILFILLSFNLYSQKIIVVDSVNKKPLSFATIQFNKGSGTYTDENGYFELNRKISDTLKLSQMSYADLVLITSEITDTIFMSPNAIIIKEIIVTNGKQVTKHIDIPKKKASFGSFPLFSKSEIISLVMPSSENSNLKIQKINFNFSKSIYNQQNDNIRTAFRVNIYDVKNKKIKDKIFSSETYIINTNQKDKIEIDLTNELISFLPNGIFIGIEAIGDINKDGSIKNNESSIRPNISENTIKDYSAITYIRYVFNKKESIKPLNEFIEKNSNKKINRNLSFGLTLVK
jgi:hypothetical protein